MLHSHRMELFACRASEDFARRVIDELNLIRNADESEQKLGALSVTQFSDGEFQPQFEDSVRGASVYILQSTIAPADNLMELLLTIDAAKRASARFGRGCDSVFRMGQTGQERPSEGRYRR